MKRITAVLLVLAMVFCAFGCKSGSRGPEGPRQYDMSKYPSDFSQWTGEDLTNFFTEAGIFRSGKGYEIWSQSHEKYFPRQPVAECVGCRNKETGFLLEIYVLDGTLEDTSEAVLNQLVGYVLENHKLPDNVGALPVGHKAGHVLLVDHYVKDAETKAQVEEVWNDLVRLMNLTPDF